MMDEETMLWCLLLGCRERGMAQLNDARGQLHRALSGLAGEHNDAVRVLVGSSLIPSLFGIYPSLDYALADLERAGALSAHMPTFRVFSFEISPADAKRLLTKHGAGLTSLCDAFAAQVRQIGASP